MNLLEERHHLGAQRMITYYFDGFRGFEQTFLPLLDVNFLLGENSTGKTSVLSAIRLIDSDTFWYTGELRSEHIDLGSFQEISTKGRAKFQLGCFVEKAPNYQFAVLATFEERNQKPVLTTVRVLFEDQEAYLSDGEQQRIPHNNQRASSIFRGWLEETSRPVVAKTSRTKSARKHDFSSIIPAHAEAILQILEGTSELNDNAWIAPIRAKPKRMYDAVGPDYSPEGDHTPYLLQKMLDSNAELQGRETLQTFGQDSGLFREVIVHRFGNDERSPLSLDVDLGFLRTSIFNVGYGVSQALPILAEVITRSQKTTFLIQQPEVHLHPKGQAALGNFFFDMSRPPHQKQFLLETHSDFIVDRFRICMRKATDAGEQIPSAQVLFFERKGDKNVITPLVLESRGEYPEDQPAEFRDFFLQEALQDLGF